MQIMDVSPFLHRTVTEFVSSAMAISAFNAASGKPDRKAVMIMIASGWRPPANWDLYCGSSSKLATADN